MKKHLDAPAAAIAVGDGLGAPRQGVGEEPHFAQFPVHFDLGHDPAPFDGISWNHAVQSRAPHAKDAKDAKERGSCLQENKSPDGERNFGGYSGLAPFPFASFAFFA